MSKINLQTRTLYVLYKIKIKNSFKIFAYVTKALQSGWVDCKKQVRFTLATAPSINASPPVYINNSIGYTQFDKIRFWVSFEVT